MTVFVYLRGDKMSKMRPFLPLLVLVLLVGFFGIPALAEQPGENDVNRPVADISIGANGIGWTPKVQYGSLVLTVSCPDGSTITKSFESGTIPYLDISDANGNILADGSYTYELQVSPGSRKTARQNLEAAGMTTMPPQQILTQTGYFQVRGGKFVTARPAETGVAKPLDEVIYDDLIVDGSLCVGNDCYSGLAFGFDTIVLMENNLRIYFDDTSNTSSFPNNDWRIVINDTTDGGGAYFAVQDVSGGLTPFTIEAGAKTNSLYVDDDGQVGIGTSGPVFELHIKEGDTPSIRLHQSTAYGWPEQMWDVGGNETSFFIRDGTHAARLPFRIEPETPSSTLCLKSDGKVGVGTWSPAYPMELETTGINAEFAVERTSGVTNFISAGSSYGFFGTTTNHALRINTNGTWRMQINTDNTLDMSDGGSYDGDWNSASSREVKENIKNLASDEAMEALEALNPVKFNYKLHKEEEKVGFIAEDVPELVATNSRKNLSTMDIVAVLTKVLQEQQRMTLEQQKIIAELKKEIAELKEKVEK